MITVLLFHIFLMHFFFLIKNLLSKSFLEKYYNFYIFWFLWSWLYEMFGKSIYSGKVNHAHKNFHNLCCIETNYNTKLWYIMQWHNTIFNAMLWHNLCCIATNYNTKLWYIMQWHNTINLIAKSFDALLYHAITGCNILELFYKQQNCVYIDIIIINFS